jgi:hypothetical protein
MELPSALAIDVFLFSRWANDWAHNFEGRFRWLIAQDVTATPEVTDQQGSTTIWQKRGFANTGLRVVLASNNC